MRCKIVNSFLLADPYVFVVGYSRRPGVVGIRHQPNSPYLLQFSAEQLLKVSMNIDSLAYPLAKGRRLVSKYHDLGLAAVRALSYGSHGQRGTPDILHVLGSKPSLENYIDGCRAVSGLLKALIPTTGKL